MQKSFQIFCDANDENQFEFEFECGGKETGNPDKSGIPETGYPKPDT